MWHLAAWAAISLFTGLNSGHSATFDPWPHSLIARRQVWVGPVKKISQEHKTQTDVCFSDNLIVDYISIFDTCRKKNFNFLPLCPLKHFSTDPDWLWFKSLTSPDVTGRGIVWGFGGPNNRNIVWLIGSLHDRHIAECSCFDGGCFPNIFKSDTNLQHYFTGIGDNNRGTVSILKDDVGSFAKRHDLCR